MVVESYKKFNYALRPSKQVERKILVEALLRLGPCGYDISAYTYLGFGSPYYADFQVFHRYLYIDRMICVEGGDIPQRMEFNKPFGSISLRLGMLGDVIPELDRNLTYFAWPDYDEPLNRSMLSDIRLLVSILSAGSVLLITVDAEARTDFEHPLDDRTREQIRADRVEEINRDIGAYLDKPLTLARYDDPSLPSVFAEALLNAVGDELTKRGDVQFCQLFNYRYRDGAQMLSLGGILDNAERIDDLTKSRFFCEWPHLNREREPIEIYVPPLTARERQELDQRATLTGFDQPLPFELDDEYLEHFAKYGRYYPQYFESIV